MLGVASRPGGLGGRLATLTPIHAGQRVPVGGSDSQAVLMRMRAYVSGLHVHGHTAIYDALVDAYQIMAAQHAADPDRIESIVLLTDGENNTGRDLVAGAVAGHVCPARGLPPW